MDEKDRVFAGFRTDRAETADRREVLTIPRRAGASGSRMVEVVRARTDAAADRPKRLDPRLRAASWEDGFPARRAVVPPAPAQPAAPSAPAPTAHVMPAWSPGPEAPARAPAADDAAPDRRRMARRRGEAPAAPARQVADPFDATDDGANCLRCGYRVEPVRDARGLMTCAACD
jgi:hypothetical protein